MRSCWRTDLDELLRPRCPWNLCTPWPLWLPLLSLGFGLGRDTLELIALQKLLIPDGKAVMRNPNKHKQLEREEQQRKSTQGSTRGSHSAAPVKAAAEEHTADFEARRIAATAAAGLSRSSLSQKRLVCLRLLLAAAGLAAAALAAAGLASVSASVSASSWVRPSRGSVCSA